jgi:hypothetical protein
MFPRSLSIFAAALFFCPLYPDSVTVSGRWYLIHLLSTYWFLVINVAFILGPLWLRTEIKIMIIVDKSSLHFFDYQL